MYKQQLTLYPVPIFIVALLLYWAAAVFVQPQLGDMLLLFDDGDLFLPGGYFTESSWLDTNLVAYQDYVVEYPPIGLYSYSLPRLFFNIYSEQDFLYAFTFIALFPMLAIFFLVLKRQPTMALFLCAPTFFYYGLCRFDTFPTLASLLAVLLVLDKRPMLGAVVLGLAIGIKWYPMVLALPLLVLQKERFKWLLVLGISTLFFCFHHIVVVGWENVLATYTFHTGRGTNGESMLYLISKYLLNNELPNLLRHVFFSLQFLPALVLAVLLWKYKAQPSREVVAISAIFSIMCFIVFAKFHSPQWLIWVIPFIVLLGDKLIAWLYLALDVVNYIAIAIVSNIVPKTDALFDIYNCTRVILSLVILYLVLKKLFVLLQQYRSETPGSLADTAEVSP